MFNQECRSSQVRELKWIQKDPQSLHCCCSLCSYSFPLFNFFPIQQSASITQKVKISNSILCKRSLTTLCNYNPRAWFCSLLQADKTVRVALPALVWKQRNKKNFSTCITLFSRGYISVCVKIPSHSRVAPVEIVLRRVTWLMSSVHQLLETVLVTMGRKIMCTFGVGYRNHPIECTNKKDKMLGTLLLPCHVHQQKLSFHLSCYLKTYRKQLIRSSRRDPITILGIKQDKCLLFPPFPPLSSSTDPSGPSARGWISPEKSEAFNMTATLQPKILL